MEPSPRSLAVSLLNRIELSGEFAEPLINETLTGGLLTEKADRGLLTLLVYGVLRWQGYLDWLISHLCHKESVPSETGLRNILRVALYQLFFTEKIPDFAVINEAVKFTKVAFPGRDKFINAVLRSARRKTIPFPDWQEDPCLYISVMQSHPRWLVERLTSLYGPEATLAICRANNEIPPYTIRVNRLKTSRSKIMEELTGLGFNPIPTDSSPDGLHLAHAPTPLTETECYRAGEVYIQDEASQLAVRLAAPQRGERVLDLCAGRGGKTTYLAELMGNEGIVVGLDINQGKVKELKKTAEKMGLPIITARRADGTRPLPRDLSGGFDLILLDAPCSGLGTLRRNPEIKWRLTGQDIQKNRRLQERLLGNAATYLKDKGRLVYVTCSILPEENEEVIREFLAEHPRFDLLIPEDHILTRFTDEQGFFRTGGQGRMDSFFGAVLAKR